MRNKSFRELSTSTQRGSEDTEAVTSDEADSGMNNGADGSNEVETPLQWEVG